MDVGSAVFVAVAPVVADVEVGARAVQPAASEFGDEVSRGLGVDDVGVAPPCQAFRAFGGDGAIGGVEGDQADAPRCGRGIGVAAGAQQELSEQ